MRAHTAMVQTPSAVVCSKGWQLLVHCGSRNHLDADVNHTTLMVGALQLRKNWGSHIDASHSRQPLVKGERLVRHEVNAVMEDWRNMQSLKDTLYMLNIGLEILCAASVDITLCTCLFVVGSSSQANCLKRNSAMDDSIGGS